MDVHGLFPDLVPLARTLIDVCRVKPTETVIILADDGTVPAWSGAFHAAAADLGCDALVYRFPARQGYMVDFPPRAVEALLHADIVFDLTTTVWAYSDTHGRFAGSGRPLRIGYVGGSSHSIETARAIPPDPEIGGRVRRACELVDGARTFRVTSRLGTDLTLQRGDRTMFPVLLQGVPVTEPRQYGDLFGGWVAMALPEEGVTGTVQYVGAYDAMGGPRQHIVDEPVELRIERGRLISIGGGNTEAQILAEWFASWHDPNSYRFSHFNIAVDHRARYHRFPDTSLHAAYAGMILAFGSNYAPGIFGPGSIVRARSHVDLTLMGASLEIDGQPLLVDGEFTKESGLASKEDKSHGRD